MIDEPPSGEARIGVFHSPRFPKSRFACDWLEIDGAAELAAIDEPQATAEPMCFIRQNSLRDV